MKELHDLELLLHSRTPIVVIESIEEQRAIQLFTRLGLRLGQPIFQWTVTDGLRRLEADFGHQEQTSEPLQLLRQIKASARPGHYLLLDFHPYLDDPLHVRLLKEIALGYDSVPITLILLSHAIDIPPELRHLCVSFDLQLPDRAAIKALIREEASRWQASSKRPLQGDREALEQLTNNLSGVTATDARRLIRNAIENDGAIRHQDLPAVMKAKQALIGQDGVISFEYDTARFSDIAGLSRLKEWLEQRRSAFNHASSSLDRPKGIMLLGVQGGGKSLAAKAVAGSFAIPLLRLDFGRLYNKFYGETEKNLRQALQIAETMAPCVLWMDEIEKGVASDGANEGLSQRVLGSLLTWMAECEAAVFIVATSNAIDQLPPELIRKGRLDEIFFIDLPSAAGRKEIFEIHLRRRNLPPSRFDLSQLTAASDGFTGAEIEQAVVASLYAAQARSTVADTALLLEELERTSPLSLVMAEKISALRAWAADRTVRAD